MGGRKRTRRRKRRGTRWGKGGRGQTGGIRREKRGGRKQEEEVRAIKYNLSHSERWMKGESEKENGRVEKFVP